MLHPVFFGTIDSFQGTPFFLEGTLNFQFFHQICKCEELQRYKSFDFILLHKKRVHLYTAPPPRMASPNSSYNLQIGPSSEMIL